MEFLITMKRDMFPVELEVGHSRSNGQDFDRDAKFTTIERIKKKNLL